MKLIRTAFSICIQNIRKWRNDYRIWTIGILLLFMLKIYVDDFLNLCQKLNTSLPFWIFPFLYQQYYMKVIFSIPLVLLFCNAPFIDDNQIYIYVRCGRTKWLFGQLLYILISSAIYYIFLMIACLLTAWVYGGTPIAEWGKVLTTVAEMNISRLGNYQFIEVSDMVIRCFKPSQACFFTFLMSWSNAVLIGIIMFALNYLLKQKYAGIIASSFLVVFSFFVEISGYPKLIYFSPVSWITLDKIDIGNTTNYPNFTYCIFFYWTMILILIMLIFLLGKKREFDLRR